MSVKTYSRTTKTGKLVEFKYSACDSDIVDADTWHVGKNGYPYRSRRLNGKNVKKYFHRLIMNEPIGDIDHINGNKLDATRGNLRGCDHSDNMKNRHSCSAASGIIGVYSKRDKWRAAIKVDGVNVSLGVFESKAGAAWARLQAEKKFFGKFRKIRR